jgi:hypothetical protein
MSDDFGTVNVRAGARSREIEMIRQRYRAHREALAKMAADAPSEPLAAEYNRLIAVIDDAIHKLDELEGRPPAPLAPAPTPPASPGSRPLVMTPGEPAPTVGRYDTAPGRSSSSSRIVLILLIGLVVLGALGWLIWRASSDRKGPQQPNVVEQPATTPATTAPAETGTVVPVATQPPASAAASLRVTPAVQDYGIIRRGTRAVRQFELTNTGSISVTIEVARSACRCLYYEYNAKKKVAPNAHETITVTVDAARAKSPALDEQIAVSAKEDPSATATIGVRAAIK